MGVEWIWGLLASSGERPPSPASHDHFYHWLALRDAVYSHADGYNPSLLDVNTMSLIKTKAAAAGAMRLFDEMRQTHPTPLSVFLCFAR